MIKTGRPSPGGPPLGGRGFMSPLFSKISSWLFVIRPKTESAKLLDCQDLAEEFKLICKHLQVSKTSKALFPEFFPTLHPRPTPHYHRLMRKATWSSRGRESGSSSCPVHSHLNPQTGCFARDPGLPRHLCKLPWTASCFESVSCILPELYVQVQY